MKRIASIVLIIVLLFTLFPIGAKATIYDTTQNEMLSDACALFPEYSEKILHQEITTERNARSTSNPELVAYLTRSISETKSMSYAEYSNGLILLSLVDYDEVDPPSIIGNGSQTNGIATNYSVHVKVTAPSISGYCVINNLEYSVILDQYDAITSVGTAYCTGAWNCNRPYVTNLSESSAPAVVEYRPQFRFGSGATNFQEVSLRIQLKNNVLSATSSIRH